MHEELYVCFEMTRCSELHTRGAPPLPEGVTPALLVRLAALERPGDSQPASGTRGS
jgi:hypothetical protein